MSEIEDKIRELKTSIEQQQRAQTKAELERDAATATITKVQARLKDEFGVDKLSDAKSTLVTLEEQLATAVAAAYEMLGQISAF